MNTAVDKLGKLVRRPVSRVLSRTAIPLGRTLLCASRDLPGQRRGGAPAGLAADVPSLFGLAPGGACHAAPIAGGPVRSYRTLSPLPHDQARRPEACGGLLSVALSRGSLLPGVTRRPASVEPGLSSPFLRKARPSSRLTRRLYRGFGGFRHPIQPLQPRPCLRLGFAGHIFGVEMPLEGSHDQTRLLVIIGVG